MSFFFFFSIEKQVPLLLQTNQLTLWLLIGCNGCTLKEQNKPNFTSSTLATLGPSLSRYLFPLLADLSVFQAS